MRINFSQFCNVGSSKQMADIFSALGDYVAVLKRHQTTFRDERYFCKLADQRNFIQHCLLSLPPGVKNAELQPDVHSAYEAFRLSGLIFSLGVVFPMSYDAAPFSTLAILLKAELQGFDMNPRHSLSCTRNMLVWILTLGAVAAPAGGSERSWFVTRLNNLAMQTGISAWSDLKSILEQVLWLNSACDSAGQQIWAEVARMRSM